MSFPCKAFNETYFSSSFVFLLLQPSPCAQLSSSECVINLYFFSLLIHLVILLKFSQGCSLLLVSATLTSFAAAYRNEHNY